VAILECHFSLNLLSASWLLLMAKRRRVECCGIPFSQRTAPSVCVGERPTAGPLRCAPVGMTSLFWVLEFWCANQLVIPTGAQRSGGTCCSVNSAEKIGDGGHYDVLFLTGELGKDGQGQYFGCGSLTFRKGTGRESQGAEGGLLMQRQGVVNL
jgi:hypothetical protein